MFVPHVSQVWPEAPKGASVPLLGAPIRQQPPSKVRAGDDRPGRDRHGARCRQSALRQTVAQHSVPAIAGRERCARVTLKGTPCCALDHIVETCGKRMQRTSVEAACAAAAVHRPNLISCAPIIPGQPSAEAADATGRHVHARREVRPDARQPERQPRVSQQPAAVDGAGRDGAGGRVPARCPVAMSGRHPLTAYQDTWSANA